MRETNTFSSTPRVKHSRPLLGNLKRWSLHGLPWVKLPGIRHHRCGHHALLHIVLLCKIRLYKVRLHKVKGQVCSRRNDNYSSSWEFLLHRIHHAHPRWARWPRHFHLQNSWSHLNRVIGHWWWWKAQLRIPVCPLPGILFIFCLACFTWGFDQSS